MRLRDRAHGQITAQYPLEASACCTPFLPGLRGRLALVLPAVEERRERGIILGAGCVQAIRVDPASIEDGTQEPRLDGIRRNDVSTLVTWPSPYRPLFCILECVFESRRLGVKLILGARVLPALRCVTLNGKRGRAAGFARMRLASVKRRSVRRISAASRLFAVSRSVVFNERLISRWPMISRSTSVLGDENGRCLCGGRAWSSLCASVPSYRPPVQYHERNERESLRLTTTRGYVSLDGGKCPRGDSDTRHTV